MTDPRTPEPDPVLRARIEALPAEVMPERDLWVDIRARLDADRVRSIAAPSQATRVRRLPTWTGRAAAAVVLIAVTATLTRWISRTEPAPVVDLMEGECVGGEWKGTKGDLTPGGGLPQCPNGHPLLETSTAPRLALVHPDTP